jgi:hypothetical protein
MFLYYLPGQSKPLTLVELRAHVVFRSLWWDLLKTDDLCQSRIVQHCVRANGPDGMSGLLLIASPHGGVTDDFRIGFYPESQIWIEADGYWIGYPKGSLPCPEQLEREYRIDGEDHVLGDERAWHCPIVRRKGTVDLPSSWGVDPKTKAFRMTVLAEYQDAWELVGHAWDYIAGRETMRLSRLLEICVQALAINYRVGAVEVSLLQLINQTNYELIFGAIVDRKFLQDLMDDQKKT